jgi:hypothetical protein
MRKPRQTSTKAKLSPGDKSSWRGYGIVVNGELFTSSSLGYLEALGAGVYHEFVSVEATCTRMSASAVRRESKLAKIRRRYQPTKVSR